MNPRDLRQKMAAAVNAEKELLLANLERNRPLIQRAAPVSILKDLFEGKPVVVFGGGPSLSDQVDRIRSIGKPFVSVACDRALLVLRGKINPTFTITVDVWHNADDLLDGCPLSNLVFDPFASPGRLERAEAKHLWTFDRPPYVTGFGEFPRGGFVGFFAVSLAAYLGARQVVLVGFDMAFRKDPYDRALPHVEIAAEDLTQVPSVQGGEVLTTVQMFAGLFELERAIERHKWRVVQTSSFGARIVGADHMSLEDAFESV